MRTVFAFAFVLALATAEKVPTATQQAWDTFTKPFSAECVAETGVKQEYADRLYLYGEYPEDHALKCYVKCISERLGILNAASGEWILDMVLRIPGITSEIFGTCNDETKADPDVCSKSFAVLKCFARHT
ncbi:uncharacterized protein LOC116173122 [Photinus pyralis]|uniref:uncharacterized protein LOC116173122 n=1 Tax=Photinus pyralis TaxID=7054 RepID=UPI001267409C|nr:uncharacterized protein LOC116173122 [Photinus pyralis]